MTFFGKADSYFQEIPDDKRVLTGPFLNASRHILLFFDKFGASFKFVKGDVSGNIEKINKHYQQDVVKYKTINAILEEPGAKGDKSLKTAHVGAVWLIRGLDFIQELLKVIFDDYETGINREGNCSDLLNKAYDKTLCKYHGTITKNLIKPFFKMAPTKQGLIGKLKESEDVTDDQVIAEMKEYHKTLAANAKVVQEAITELGVQG